MALKPKHETLYSELQHLLAMRVLTRSMALPTFRFSSYSSFSSRRWTWLRYLGYLTCLITILQTCSFLSNHPETNLVQATYDCFHRPPILRPGQYQRGADVASVAEEAPGEVPADPDEVGMAHVRRFVFFFFFFQS